MTKNRLYGLDLLRIISMILITVIHYIGYSRILSNPSLHSFNGIILNMLSALTTIAVNIFVLTTGYFSCEKKVNFKRIFFLWAQVVVISIALTVIGFLCLNKSFSIVPIVKTFFPILTGHFWFFAMYVVLNILSPFINVLVANLSKKWHFALCVLGFLIISVFFVSNPLISHYTYIANPRGICWFVYLYIVGAYIKKHGINVSKLILGLSGMVLFAGIFALKFIGIEGYGNMKLTEDYSVLSLAFSVVAFALFKDASIKAPFIQKIVTALSSCSFFVYIIQEHDLIRNWYWGLFKINEYASTPLICINLLVSVLALWPIAFIVSKLLSLLNPVFAWIYARVEKMVVWIMIKIKSKISLK